jgi:hypothetical protein
MRRFAIRIIEAFYRGLKSLPWPGIRIILRIDALQERKKNPGRFRVCFLAMDLPRTNDPYFTDGRYPFLSDSFLLIFLPKVEVGLVLPLLHGGDFSLGLAGGIVLGEALMEDNHGAINFPYYDLLEALGSGGLSLIMGSKSLSLALLPRYQIGPNVNFDKSSVPRSGLSKGFEILGAVGIGPLGISAEYGQTNRSVDLGDYKDTTTTSYWKITLGYRITDF